MKLYAPSQTFKLAAQAFLKANHFHSHPLTMEIYTNFVQILLMLAYLIFKEKSQTWNIKKKNVSEYINLLAIYIETIIFRSLLTINFLGFSLN